MTLPSPSPIPIDIAIIGGGVAGLWTRARLTREGYSCVLLEASSLGTGQTIASQGIIHGGVKYALTGQATDASKAISEMPAIWRACFRGEGEINLRAAQVLSERQYLWTTTGIGSRIAGLAASKMIRTSVETITGNDRPEAWRDAPSGVSLYGVDEPVLDPKSMLAALRDASDSPIVRLQEPTWYGSFFPFLDQHPHGQILRLHDASYGPIPLLARRVVFAAGAGTAEFINWFTDLSNGDSPLGPLPKIQFQTRPLHMLMARGDLPMIFGHCVGFSDKPRITITSQKDAQGRTVWYIGGDIAESGVNRSRDDQIREAQREIAACLPWLTMQNIEWSTLRVDRAEGIVSGPAGARPDGPVVAAAGHTIIAYPTKLAFAPLLASRVLDELRAADIRPSEEPSDLSALADLERPEIARLPWEEESLQWT